MSLKKREIGEELKLELNKGFNIQRISNWADDLFVSLRNKHSPEIDNILRNIFLMDAGPEFEYTEQELRILADLLINEVDDSIKQVDDLKFKKHKRN